MLNVSIRRFQTLVKLLLDAISIATALHGYCLCTDLIVIGNAALLARLDASVLGQVINSSVILPVRANVLAGSFHANAERTVFIVLLDSLEARFWRNMVRCLAGTTRRLAFLRLIRAQVAPTCFDTFAAVRLFRRGPSGFRRS